MESAIDELGVILQNAANYKISKANLVTSVGKKGCFVVIVVMSRKGKFYLPLN